MRRLLRKLYYKSIPFYHKLQVLRLKHKKKINVVFFAMNYAMWHYQELYELMVLHPKFNPLIVITPFFNYVKDQQEQDLNNLRSFFDSKNISYIEPYDNMGNIVDIKETINPDIVFFQQLYHHIAHPLHDASNFYDKLICYHPYALWLGKEDWGFNLKGHNFAWKLFYATEIHHNVAKVLARNKGINVNVVGYSKTDEFLNHNHIDVWKQQEAKKKRIIWAPHFTIDANRCFTAHSEFLWMADFMLQTAKQYADEIQFAFKPHPRLLTELYHHKDWGKEKADAYYKQWDSMPNTQVETGNYVDLFMTSDALIHDCGSFCAEYHYSQNPSMFVSKDINHFRDTFNDFGKKAIDLHYLGKDETDVTNFIEEVVLKGKDTRLSERIEFYNKYLLPPNGKKAAENMMNNILHTIYD